MNRNSIMQYPNSNHALHAAHRAWVPSFNNPFNVVLTFAHDINEQFARDKYHQLIHGISRKILNNGYGRFVKLIEQRGYLEYGSNGRYHIHTLFNIYLNWNNRIIPMVYSMWIHGLVILFVKVPVNELTRVHAYNSKMRTKKTESGHYSDSLLIVTK